MLKKLLLWITHPYRVKAKPMGALPETVYYRREPPERTEKMVRDGFVWAEQGDAWTEVCLTCGGNCGQCGTSLGMGNAVNLDRLIQSTGMNQPVAGLPRG